MITLQNLWKEHKKLMTQIDKVASTKFKLETKLCEIISKINKIETEQRHKKFREYLKQNPLKCKHEPTKSTWRCDEDYCGTHDVDCIKCGGKELEVIVDNVWATKEECIAIWQGALKKK